MMSDDLHAYVISLQSQPARRAASIARLEGRLPYTIVDAVDGSILSDDAIRAYTNNMYCAKLGRPLSRGEIGCSLSHKRSLEMFVNTGASFGLILEDDFAVNVDTFAALNTALELITQRADVDLVKMGGSGPLTSRGVRVAEAEGVSLIATLTYGCLSHAYLVSRTGAMRLAAAVTPVREPYDHLLRNTFLHGCQLYETSPWVFCLDQGLRQGSTIEADRADLSRRKLAPADRANRQATKLLNSVRKRLWALDRFGWRGALRPQSFNRFPSGEAENMEGQ